jgi:hypothetical protein
MLKFLREYRGIYVAATAAVLLIQIPITIIEIPRIGTARYGLELRQGIVGAFKTAWGN